MDTKNETKNFALSGALILGAGLMYLLDPERIRERKAPDPWKRGLQCVVGALSLAAVAYGAGLIAQRVRRDSSTSTPYDIDMPNYAWLR
jgi:hypothetical protein